MLDLVGRGNDASWWCDNPCTLIWLVHFAWRGPRVRYFSQVTFFLFLHFLKFLQELYWIYSFNLLFQNSNFLSCHSSFKLFLYLFLFLPFIHVPCLYYLMLFLLLVFILPHPHMHQSLRRTRYVKHVKKGNNLEILLNRKSLFLLQHPWVALYGYIWTFLDHKTKW